MKPPCEAMCDLSAMVEVGRERSAKAQRNGAAQGTSQGASSQGASSQERVLAALGLGDVCGRVHSLLTMRWLYIGASLPAARRGEALRTREVK